MFVPSCSLLFFVAAPVEDVINLALLIRAALVPFLDVFEEVVFEDALEEEGDVVFEDILDDTLLEAFCLAVDDGFSLLAAPRADVSDAEKLPTSSEKSTLSISL